MCVVAALLGPLFLIVLPTFVLGFSVTLSHKDKQVDYKVFRSVLAL